MTIIKQNHPVYSRIDEIPKGRANDSITPGCMVIEGGSLRAIYACGVLDALMSADINMETTIGVSAGAMIGSLYVSGQIGHGARYNLNNRFNPDYVGPKAMVLASSPFNCRLPYETTDASGTVFDRERFDQSPRRFVCVATDCETGEAVYFEKGQCNDIVQCIRASATLPMVSRMVEAEGRHCLDGGCSDAVPADWAIAQGFEKIIVVRTRERSFRKEAITKKEAALIQMEYRHYPNLVQQLLSSNERYNALCDRLEQQEKEGCFFVFAPSVPPTVSRLEGDLEKMGDLYWLGWNDAQARMAELRHWLGDGTSQNKPPVAG